MEILDDLQDAVAAFASLIELEMEVRREFQNHAPADVVLEPLARAVELPHRRVLLLG